MVLPGAQLVQRWIVMIQPLRYSKEREQFGKPIGGFQLQQKKLAEMITEITKAQLLNWRFGCIDE
jgi:glutaryl-CoA dehydrogenase